MEHTIKDLIPYKSHIEDLLLELVSAPADLVAAEARLKQVKNEAIALVNANPTAVTKYLFWSQNYVPDLYFYGYISVDRWTESSDYRFTSSETQAYLALLQPLSDEYTTLLDTLSKLSEEERTKTKLENYLAYLSCEILHSGPIDVSFLRELCIRIHTPNKELP
jgi:hypothetical protein